MYIGVRKRRVTIENIKNQILFFFSTLNQNNVSSIIKTEMA